MLVIAPKGAKISMSTSDVSGFFDQCERGIVTCSMPFTLKRHGRTVVFRSYFFGLLCFTHIHTRLMLLLSHHCVLELFLSRPTSDQWNSQVVRTWVWGDKSGLTECECSLWSYIYTPWERWQCSNKMSAGGQRVAIDWIKWTHLRWWQRLNLIYTLQ